ncbi:MAG: cation:proton antiporter [Phycisphaerales bacterium]|nr:cation:proton antiporter [Phycisphaerales bacterium]
MTESILLAIAGIVVLGVTAQWLAWRIGLPSILLLLIFGIIAGPGIGWIKPDALFDDLLFPSVSLAVALILYEGGLSLKLSELAKVGTVVRNLVSVGALATWVVSLLAARIIIDLPWGLSALLGAVLVVTGPTVIGPLLRQIRPSGSAGPVLKWEGIVIDPIGALLAVLILEVLVGEAEGTTSHMLIGVVKTIVFGGGIGLAAAGLLILVLARYWVADYLQNGVSLMLVIVAFAASNQFQHESGLLAVTVMGFVLANQKRVAVKNIVEFKENLRVLLISSLFVVLAARLELEALSNVAGRGLLFVAVLILVARPLCVLVSTLNSELTLRERIFLAWMAPRGIVAAAVASVFALRLQGAPGADLLVPITFLTIMATVTWYGLTATFVARRLGVAEANPQGILFVGAQDWVREIASALKEKGHRVLLVDNNWENVNAARMAGLPTFAGSILAENTISELNLGGIGRILAMTPNDWVNVLAVHRFEGIFGKANCFQLPPHEAAFKKREGHKHLHGRLLFDEESTYDSLVQHHLDGFSVKATKLSQEFDYAAYRDRYGESAVPLFLINDKDRLDVITTEQEAEPNAGQTLVGLVKTRPE